MAPRVTVETPYGGRLISDDGTGDPPAPRPSGEHPAIRMGMSAGAKALGAILAAIVLGTGAIVAAKWGAVEKLATTNSAQHVTINARLTATEDRTEDIYQVVVEKKDPMQVMRDRAKITQERLRRGQP
jgi:hypothetical protein